MLKQVLMSLFDTTCADDSEGGIMDDKFGGDGGIACGVLGG